MEKEIKKKTFSRIEIQKCDNGFIVCIDNAKNYDKIIGDGVFVFNSITNLANFILKYDG